MAQFVLHHRHTAAECGAVFASFRGHASPLRRTPTKGSCPHGGHDIWWLVEASSADAALALLPEYVAQRTELAEVGDVRIP
jgi:hypothetical protein